MRLKVAILYLLLILLGRYSPVHAFAAFTISDIRVEGLQRIAIGTVFNYLPAGIGDIFDEDRSSQAIRALYRTGFFKDVAMEREGDVLVIFVAERPAIAEIEIKGNVNLSSEQLEENLRRIGLSEGRIFDRSLLDQIRNELQQQYLSMGRYTARIESRVTPLERNRVAISILIEEGEEAAVRNINIVGNRVFSEDELLFLFNVEEGDDYSKQQLSGDIETLRSHYMDRGYIDFDIQSIQVTISPDKQDVYTTINIVEGDKYTVSDVALSGQFVVDEAELRTLVTIKSGDLFSRRAVSDSSNAISKYLGDAGYAFANVNVIPTIDREKQEVALVFFIDPAQRVNVRRIEITGNSATRDEVIRRELRQMESAWISTQQVERSKTRLDRLGFFEQVNVSTPAVAGAPDMVDIDFNVIERDTFGSFNVGVGYGAVQGLTFNISVNQENFLGSGYRFNLAAENSTSRTRYNFSFTDPYYTLDGISRTFNIFYSKTDTDTLGTSDYRTDSYGAGLSYSVPVSEYNALRYGVTAERYFIYTNTNTPQHVTEFCSDNTHKADCRFDTARTNLSWTYDTRDKAFFPDNGLQSTITAELAVPLFDSAIEYYKLRYNHRQYINLSKDFTFMFNGELAHADEYGSTRGIPPFEHYFAGGMRTVRGFRPNSLGPLDENGDSIGGKARVAARTELRVVPPFAEKSRSSRLSLFVDAGNVYRDYTEVALSELRSSAGVGLLWLTPIGPMAFSVARPINEKAEDRTEFFQFTLGVLY